MIGSNRHEFAPVISNIKTNRPTVEASVAAPRSATNQEKMASTESTRPRARRKGNVQRKLRTGALVLSLLSAAPTPVAAECISLSGSTTCPAFGTALVSTSDFLVGLFPFMKFVKDTSSFDEQMKSFVQTSYVAQKYQDLLGCDNINLTNTSNLYARFTTSVICNAIIQNSINDCKPSTSQSRPLCAESCAQYAESEAYIAADSALCQSPNSNAQTQIRADFTNCALPANSLSSASCVTGISNEPENCGYGNSLVGLCSYCASGGINSTDTCCYNSDIDKRCAGVVLPSITPTVSFTTSPTSTASSTSTAVPGTSDNRGLSGGAIAGIVIGSVLGLALLAFLLFLCIRMMRRRNGSQKGSIFNQPSPSRHGPSTTQLPSTAKSTAPQGYEVLPGGRIARMSALEGHSRDSPSRHGESRHGGVGTAAAGMGAAYMAGRTRSRRGDNHSSSDEFGDSPTSETRPGVLRPPPTTMRRTGSLSSNSILIGEDPQSPGSAGGMSSPQGVASQQSEQLPFFKDYYSQDDIHPGDRVAVLWAYQPRAADEFALERGDMLKVVGIWDDGWATGVMMDERADEWEARRQSQRDSGVSHTSGRGRETSPPVSGEIKAFPLVCVCLPEHWRKTIEGDGSTETGSTQPSSTQQAGHHR